jgi:hypothetical protein
MEEISLIDSLAGMLEMPERWMIQDDEKNLHELTDGVKGTPVLVSGKKEIYQLYFGKERISPADFLKLDEVHTELMKFIWDNFSHKVKSESQESLGDILNKYQLKKINKREKK